MRMSNNPAKGGNPVRRNGSYLAVAVALCLSGACAARADAEAVDPRFNALEASGDGRRSRARVGGMEPRDRLRDEGRVADPAPQRARPAA